MDNKKYYWLKLKDSFFKDKEIKKLRRIAGGDTYTIIYLKLQLLSLKNEGKLLFDNLEDSFSEEMALEIDEDVENVKVTLSYLHKCGLIEELNENEFILPQTIECIGGETQVAARVRKHRENEKALQCNTLVTKCNTEIDKEIEIKKEIDILPTKVVDHVPYEEIVEYFNTLCTSLSKVITINKKRKDKLKARWGELKTLEQFETIFNKVQASNFLKGSNKNNWKCTFDWLIENDNNYVKVLEGQYDNNKETQRPTQPQPKQTYQQGNNKREYKDVEALLNIK